MLLAIVWWGPRAFSSAATAACIAAVESLAPVGSAPKSAGTIGELAALLESSPEAGVTA